MKKLKVILIGAGGRGTGYTNIMTKYPEKFEVIAVADPNDLRRNFIKEKHNIPEEMCFENWDELFKQPKLADVAIIATIANTTPFELTADVMLLDGEGNPSEAQVRIAEGAKILGSSDGVTPAESVVRLEVDLGRDGRVSNLGVVDGLQFELSATSAANETSVALNEEQYIGVKLQLELAGGITIDLDKLQ